MTTQQLQGLKTVGRGVALVTIQLSCCERLVGTSTNVVQGLANISQNTGQQKLTTWKSCQFVSAGAVRLFRRIHLLCFNLLKPNDIYIYIYIYIYISVERHDRNNNNDDDDYYNFYYSLCSDFNPLKPNDIYI